MNQTLPKLNNKLLHIIEHINSKPEITLTYFVKDNKKNGGKYVDKTGIVRKIDMIEQYIQFMDKTKIFIDDILSIKSSIYDIFEDK